MTRTMIAAASAGAVLLLTACGSGTTNHSTAGAPPSATSMSGTNGMNMSPGSGGKAAPTLSISSQHNDADASFTNEMIPHHSQAVDMASKELRDGQNAQVKALAMKIRAAQAPEINLMNGFLTAWGVPPAGHQGHGSTMSMPGMMSEATMLNFLKLKAAALDKSFLTLMIAHHEGALAMAKTESSNGNNPQAKALAQSIITSQNAEITTMKKLLTQI